MITSEHKSVNESIVFLSVDGSIEWKHRPIRFPCSSPAKTSKFPLNAPIRASLSICR